MNKAIPVKPVTILIAAMGGEGGGVLADWLIDAATVAGFPVQSTSVPGVAQRTGATTYYVEVFPIQRSSLHGLEPVLSLTPNPGDVDIVAASELVEAGRVLQGGFVNSQRTVLLASTHREYAVSEKSAMGDGRYNGQRVLDAAEKLAHKAILFDMRELAQRNGTVINTVVFGAMAASGILPFSREACEDSIRRSGKAVDASLRGFAAGYERAISHTPAADQGELDKPASKKSTSNRVLQLTESVRDIANEGMMLTTDFQSAAYALRYLERVEKMHQVEAPSVSGERAVTREVARYLALWMSFEDVIRIADLKTRHDRIAKVRKEVGARNDEPILLTEYLKPGFDEVCSLLPPRLAQWLKRTLSHRADQWGMGLHMRTDTILGFGMLCLLRSLRPIRPYGSRYITENLQIDRWLQSVQRACTISNGLALELALCGNLVKGYGETSERGHRSLCLILDETHLALKDSVRDTESLVQKVRAARLAALSDPEGRQLAGVLGTQPPELKAHPIRIVRRQAAQ